MAKQVSGKETKGSFNELWLGSRASGEGGRLGKGRRKRRKERWGGAPSNGVLSSSRCHTAGDTNDPPDRLTPPSYPTPPCFLYGFGFFTPSPLSMTLVLMLIIKKNKKTGPK